MDARIRFATRESGGSADADRKVKPFVSEVLRGVFLDPN
jgi:hypothetical protein